MISLDIQLAMENLCKSMSIAPPPPAHAPRRQAERRTPGNRRRMACMRSLSFPVPFPCTIRAYRMPRLRDSSRFPGRGVPAQDIRSH